MTFFPKLFLFFCIFYAVKYINQDKEKIIEGELRVKQLAEYLEKLKAPRKVWISEDGSGIVAKVSYDSSSNQLVGLVLPIDKTTGMPIRFTFSPHTVEDINQQITQNSKSTLVYVILAQPIVDHVPPFILQVYGTDNKFTSENVLMRWQHIKDQLAR